MLAELAAPAAAAPRPALSIPLEWFRWIPPCEALFARCRPPCRSRRRTWSGGSSTVMPSGRWSPSTAASPSASPVSTRCGQRTRPCASAGSSSPVRSPRVGARGGVLPAARHGEGAPRATPGGRRRLHDAGRRRARLVAGPPGATPPPGDCHRGRWRGVRRDERRVGLAEVALARMPRLRRFATDAATAIGLPADRLVPVHGSPEELMAERGADDHRRVRGVPRGRRARGQRGVDAAPVGARQGPGGDRLPRRLRIDSGDGRHGRQRSRRRSAGAVAEPSATPSAAAASTP